MRSRRNKNHKRNGELRWFHASNSKSETLAKYLCENISEDVEVIITDEWPGYPDAMRRTGLTRHKTIQHEQRISVNGEIHTNTVENAFSC